MDLHFVPFPGPSSSGDQVLGKRGHCNLLPPLSLLLGFLGVKLAHLLRCAVCLFWGADLWLRPAWWMSTIQNPKKSWLATKPACSLVDDASLGLQLPLLALAAPTCLSPAGDGLVRSWLALLSPLFCEWAWRYLRLGLFVELLSHCLVCWEKAMAPHSSTLAWKIPWTEEPGGLQSMGSLRVEHD